MLFIGLAMAVMLFLGWRKWPDLIVDFGQQLYIPWRLAEGDVLYRDIIYLPGGLSQWWNGLLFRILGTSLTVLLVANVLTLLGLAAMVYRGFQAAAGELVAVMAGLALVIVFALSHYLDVGNYNYIAPYAHDAVQGTLLNVAIVLLLTRWLRAGRGNGLLLTAGALLGLVLQTKPEIFLGGAAVVGMAGLLRIIEKKCPVDLLRHGAVLLGGMLLTVGGYYLFYRLRTGDPVLSARATVWAWLPVFESKLAGNPFFKSGMGMDAPGENIRQMALASGLLLAAVVGIGWAARRWANEPRARLVLLLLVGSTSLFCNWLECGRPLLLLSLVGIAGVGWQWWQGSVESRAAKIFPLLWLALGLGYLAKMGVHPRIWHYGVFLAMPAFLGGIYLLLGVVPKRWGQGEALGRMLLAAFLAVGFFRLALHTELYLKDKTYAVGTGGDKILAFAPTPETPQAPVVAEAVAWLQQNTRPEETLGAVPEGALLNYLARRRNPTPYVVFMSEITVFGEETIFAAYRQHPPDYMALVHRKSFEYGYDYFGKKAGYGQEMMQWILANYEPVQLFGAEPLQKDAFGIKIMKRKTAANPL